MILDSKDKQILYQLDLNARQSFREIGKKVKLSKEVVNYRIRNMEKLGIIKGYHTVINMSTLGYMCNRMFFKLRNTPPEKEKEIINYCIKSKNWWVVSADGYINLGIGSWEKDLKGIKNAREEFLDKYSQNIESFEQSTYLGFYIYRRAYLTNKKIKESNVIEYIKEKKDFDLIDLKILEYISENARAPTINIAKDLSLAINTVTDRIKKMQEKNIIEAFRPTLDLSKIGYYWYKVSFILKENTKKKDLLNYFSMHPNIVFAFETTGKYNIEFELEVESNEKFKKILDEIRTKFSESIESYDSLLWNKEHKYVLFQI